MPPLFKVLWIFALMFEPSLSFMPVHILAKPRIQALSASIQEDVGAKMKEAMKAKDIASLPTLRAIKSALTNVEKETGVEGLSDEAALTVLRKLAKQRQESIDMYLSAKSETGDERAASEGAELKIIEQWLPSLADEATTRQWVVEAIAAAGDTPNAGKIMGALMKEHKGILDGKLAQKIVKEELG